MRKIEPSPALRWLQTIGIMLSAPISMLAAACLFSGKGILMLIVGPMLAALACMLIAPLFGRIGEND